MIWQIVLIGVLILCNGLFAMAEIAIVSARPARLQQRLEKGQKSAGVALQLARDPDRLLSTVQIGITLIGILAGAVGGAALAQPVAEWLRTIGGEWIQPYAYGIGLVVVTAIIGYVSLIIGELVPKRWALHHAETLACRLAPLMQWLARLAAPVVGVLTVSSSTVLKILGVSAKKEPLVSEEEIHVMMRQGTEAGIFEAAEQNLVEGVFDLSEHTVSQVMTPQSDIVFFDLNEPAEHQWKKLARVQHSHFPVCRGGIDEVVGVASVTSLWFRHIQEQSIDMKTDVERPVFIPLDASVLQALEMFQQTGRHLALVVDEFGSIKGVITLNNVVESLIGAALPEHQRTAEADIIEREDGSFLIDGAIAFEEFQNFFGMDEDAASFTVSFHTLAGFVLHQLGRIPQTGDHFVWKKLRFEIIDMDQHRIDKVLVEKQ